ncbi:hypothetical protein BGX23_003234 [Mortierella sp. AD031]|nr:hypothetical protein BGX23_003234 [Mortierella sp. AD031]KAG0214679.1 hypothetical protein BGX33_001937 [Mortierella sp. NVP41]
MVSTGSNCSVVDFETFKRGQLHKQHPHMLNYRPHRPSFDAVTITNATGSPLVVHGVAAVPIIADGRGLQASDVYLIISAKFNQMKANGYDNSMPPAK